MSNLNKKIQDAYIRLKNEAVYGIYGNRYIPQNKDGKFDNQINFPNIEDPTNYVTNIPVEQEEVEEAEKGKSAFKKIEDKMKEMEKNVDTSPSDESEETPEETPEDEEIEDTDDSSSEETFEPEGEEEGGEAADLLNADPSGATGEEGVGGMLNSGGETPEDKTLTATSLGRVYELKKIYSRLSSVESFLSRTTDDDILEIRKMVSNAIDLFELVISNFEQYKENVDEIIITYYKFLDVVYDSIRTHFKQISKQ